MHFDTEDYQRRTALADELRALPDRTGLCETDHISHWMDSGCLYITKRGGLVLRSVFDALGIRD